MIESHQITDARIYDWIATIADRDIASWKLVGVEKIREFARAIEREVRADEREACAQLCEAQHEEDRPSDYAYNIRARGTGGEG